MTTTLYLVTYTAIARNVSPAALATRLAAVPRDTATETLLGLSSLADVTTTNSPFAVRSMSYASAPGALAPDPQLGAFLANYYTATFSAALSTPVLPSPVSSLVVPAAPLLWVRADAGANNPCNDWRDLSGHNRNLLQSSSGEQPSVGQPVPGIVSVVFSGGQLLATAAPIPFDAFSYFVSFESGIGSTAGLVLERSIDATANSGENLYPSTGDAHSIVATRNATTHTADATLNWGITGNFLLASYLFDDTSGGDLFINFSSTAAAHFAPLTAQAVSADLFVGARSGLVLPFTGAIREILLFDRRLSPAQAAPVQSYMGAQIGL